MRKDDSRHLGAPAVDVRNGGGSEFECDDDYFEPSTATATAGRVAAVVSNFQRSNSLQHHHGRNNRGPRQTPPPPAPPPSRQLPRRPFVSQV